MSQSKTWSINLGTTVRQTSSGARSGAGGSTRFYVGRYDSKDHWSFLRPALDWTNVGRIVSATLSLYVDDGLGSAYGDTLGASGSPTFRCYRLTSAFSEHSNSDTWTSGDDTAPTKTTSGGVKKNASRSALELTQIDITAIVNAWAPTTVQTSTGAMGTAQTNYGLGLYPDSTSTADNAAFISEDAEAPLVAYIPVITLVYEYGLTTPDTPTTLVPSGAVTSAAEFTGAFSDIDTTDLLKASEVELYDAGHAATIATNDLVTSAAHGLAANDIIYFTSLTAGTGLSTFTPYYVIASGLTTGAFKVSATRGGAAVNVTVAYTAATWSKRIYQRSNQEGSAAIAAATFHHDYTGPALVTGTTYRWRGRVTDNEGSVSAWTALTSFSVTDTAPTVTNLAPSGQTYSTLDSVQFTGTFSDADTNDTMSAYQVQLSAFPSGDPGWNTLTNILWDTGKRVALPSDTAFRTPYGGQPLDAGTYYVRARVWDNHDSVSAWVYVTVILDTNFIPTVESSINAIQLRPRAPWRIVIKEMKFNTIGGNITGVAATNVLTSASAHGLTSGRKVRFSALTGGTGLLVGTDYWVISSGLTTTAFKVSLTQGGAEVDFSTAVTGGTLTAVTTRGPGNTVAVIEDAFNVGASKMYNSPGEAHWTLKKSHPQISVIEPKQTHYAIEFRQGDGWREVFAGLVDDFDASGQDIIFYGIDYLGLLQRCMDLRYDPNVPDKAYNKGGSKYSNVTVRNIIINQLATVRGYANSLVGFISTGTISAALTTPVTIFSTYTPTLQFIAGLLDSYRAGSGKYTAITVQPDGSGGYSFVVTDDPGVARDNLRLRYGELVQGYRVIPFGANWSTRVAGVGRDRDGVKVRYTQEVAPNIDEYLYGMWPKAAYYDNLTDGNDFARRVREDALRSSALGSQLGLGLRSGFLQPRDGYDLLDKFPVSVEDGPVSTTAMGHGGYWRAVGITWQALQQGDLSTTLTLVPDESDGSAPSADLLTVQPISSQREWQIGWTPATTPTTAPTAKYWLNQTTGKVYAISEGSTLVSGITGDI